VVAVAEMDTRPIEDRGVQVEIMERLGHHTMEVLVVQTLVVAAVAQPPTHPLAALAGQALSLFDI
jgi:hypothetical protein